MHLLRIYERSLVLHLASGMYGRVGTAVHYFLPNESLVEIVTLEGDSIIERTLHSLRANPLNIPLQDSIPRNTQSPDATAGSSFRSLFCTLRTHASRASLGGVLPIFRGNDMRDKVVVSVIAFSYKKKIQVR